MVSHSARRRKRSIANKSVIAKRFTPPDFGNKKDEHPIEGCSSNSLMVDLREIAQNHIMAIDGKVIEVSRNWFCITTLLRK